MSVTTKIATFLGSIQWTELRYRLTGKRYDLEPAQVEVLKQLLAENHYVVLLNRKNDLTTYLTGFLSFCLSGKWPDYSHALLNIDKTTRAEDFESFQFIEATGKGVHVSSFDSVLNCDRICLLRLKNMNAEDWDAAMEFLYEQIGKEYDLAFNLANSDKQSCVEVVYHSLKAGTHLPNLEKDIAERGNLTPQMFRNCKDFLVAYETP